MVAEKLDWIAAEATEATLPIESFCASCVRKERFRAGCQDFCSRPHNLMLFLHRRLYYFKRRKLASHV
jgi:hypothetical protein